MGSHRSHLNLVSLRTARCSSASCSVEAKTSWTAIFRIQGLDQPATGCLRPTRDLPEDPSRPASLHVTISRPPSIRSVHPIGTHSSTTPRPEMGGPLPGLAAQVWRSPWPCPLHRSLL